MKNTQEFLDELKKNRELTEELADFLIETKTQNQDLLLEATSRFAEEKGYDFHTNELIPARTGSFELSDDDLDQISGGGFLSRLTGGLRKFFVGTLGVPIIKI